MSSGTQGPREPRDAGSTRGDPANRVQGAPVNRPRPARTGQARGNQGRRPRPSGPQRGSRAREQARRSNTGPIVAGGIVAVVVLIAIVALIIHQVTGSGSAAPTPTPVPTAAPTTVAAVIPSAPLTAGQPSATELATSAKDCAPFLKAGNGKQGPKSWSQPPTQVINNSKHYQVKLYTTYGTITADILPKLAPITANSFIFLACNGFYNGLDFHRIVPGFVIQGGDPKGDGTGGPGYQFKDETVARPYTIGSLAMANSGPNTNGSQFFVIQGPQGVALPAQYNLFGQVTRGENVVDKIANAPAHAGSDGANSAPNAPVHITKVTVQVS